MLIFPLPCVHLSVPPPEKWRKGRNWWESSQILALNTSVSRLCFTGLYELTDILKGKQLEWFHLGLCWHYEVNSVALLCGHWTAVPLAFQLYTVFGRYSIAYLCFLNITFLMDDWAVLRKWNQTSPKSAKNPSASAPSGLLSVLLFDFSQIYEGSISFCSLFLHVRECNTLSALSLTWIYWHFCVCNI